MSDILFLSVKEILGKRVDDDYSAIISTATETDTATQTAGTGKDMYLGGAKISWTKNSAAAGPDENYVVKLYANGVELESRGWLAVGNQEGDQYEFKTKGVKVNAGEIIKITFKGSNTDNKHVRAKLILWEETDTVSPLNDFT